jgi:hypothetical protein
MQIDCSLFGGISRVLAVSAMRQSAGPWFLNLHPLTFANRSFTSTLYTIYDKISRISTCGIKTPRTPLRPGPQKPEARIWKLEAGSWKPAAKRFKNKTFSPGIGERKILETPLECRPILLNGRKCHAIALHGKRQTAIESCRRLKILARDRHAVTVRMSADRLVRPIRLDRVRRSACLAVVHAVLQHENIRLLGKIDLAHIDLPRTVRCTLRRHHRHRQDCERCGQEYPLHCKPPARIELQSGIMAESLASADYFALAGGTIPFIRRYSTICP